MTQPPSLARQAARFARALGGGDLPPDVRAKAATCLLDFLSCCVCARTLPWAPSMLRYLDRLPAAAEAYQWGLGRRIAAADAAFGNGTLGHSLIREDMHVASGNHIGVMVIPAIVALAERESLPGQALVRGIVAGYEVTARLGMAVRSGLRNRHFRPSGISGAFGVAAGAIAALGLDEDVAVRALGFAANFAAGLNEWAWAGGQEIYVHAGMAARNGLMAADLARAGMKSSETVLEGVDGMFAAYGSGPDAARIFADSMAAGFLIRDVKHKPFAGCNFIQTPIAAALQLRHKLDAPLAETDQVVIRTFPAAQAYPGCDYHGPFSSMQQSKMSLQYGVAAALLFSRIDENAYMAFADNRLMQLITRCRLEVEDGYRAAYPARQPVTVEVKRPGGQAERCSLEDVPWLSSSAVEDRFRQDAQDCFSANEIDRICEIVGRLWELPDSRLLTGLFP